MITSLSIENFRRFKRINIDGLKRLTLISGKNNIGKSTILEALFLMLDHSSQNSFLKIASYRGLTSLDADNLWKPLFTDMVLDKDIRISINENNEKNTAELVYSKDTEYVPFSPVGVSDDVISQLRSATRSSYSLAYHFNHGEYQENGHFSTDGRNILADVKTSLDKNEIRSILSARLFSAAVTRFQKTTTNDIGKLELAGKKNVIIKILKKLDPSIDDIVTISLYGEPQLYVSAEEKLLPIQFAGDGLVKLLSIVVAIMLMHDGLVLFDELETGFHYSMHENLWKIIDEVSLEANCQVIATTHSYELIKAAIDGVERTDDFAYFRLGKSKEGIAAYGYDYGLLNSALKSEMEVR